MWEEEISTISRYIYLWDIRIATLETRWTWSTLVYHYSDHLSWANIDTDPEGNILQSSDYKPFGEVRKLDQTSEYKNKYLFWGKEEDIESWLQYFEARYYDNVVWRFSSQDRVFWEVGSSERAIKWLTDPQKFNSYSYVSNNPVVRTDKSWEWWDTAVDAVVAVWWIAVWSIIWDKYLVEWAKNMLVDTGKGALNPLKKVRKLKDAWSKVLNNKQLDNLKRFIKKIPSNSKESVNTKIDTKWNATFKATSPWKVPWSKAVYEKNVDIKWNTTWYNKTTYWPKWEFIHKKDKINK